MKRRAFLTRGLAIGASGTWFARRALAQMPGMDMSHGDTPGKGVTGPSVSPGDRIPRLPAGAPLPPMGWLKNTASQAGHFEGLIEASVVSAEFVPGLSTPVFAYNGTIPGPLIAATEGDRVKIIFRNRLPGQATTLHWHGLEIPPDQDGGPHTPVGSGAERIYDFTIPEGTAGSYWYHPHPHGHTAEQVYRGLAAPFIVRSKADPLSQDLGDTTLFITTLSLNIDGSIAKNTHSDVMNGRRGDHVLVNGALRPVLTLPPGSSRRFRIYNATGGRFLRLSLEGHTMILVGTDGGLLSAPVRNMGEIFLAPAERVEIVVDFSSAAGRVALMAHPWDHGWMGPGEGDVTAFPVMTFELAGAPATAVPVAEKLRPISPLDKPVAHKRLELGESMEMTGGMMQMDFLINGKAFDISRIDLVSRTGDTELWEISNGTDMDHPVHIHGTQFQIVEREVDGTIMPAPFLAWKDTVNIARRETVRIKLRFTTPGLRMYHCHILEHEDAGMMGTLNVIQTVAR